MTQHHPEPNGLGSVLRIAGGSEQHAERLEGGFDNVAYRTRRADGTAIVVRCPLDPLREDTYPVEVWAAREASRVGIPVAQPLMHGMVGGLPFSVFSYVEPDERAVLHPWTWLGRYARAARSIPLDDAPRAVFSRFGRNLERAWSAHIGYNREALGVHDPLRADGAYGSAAQVESLLEPLASRRFEFGLAHGDLAPRNLLSRGTDAPPVLIDWGAAETGPSPWSDARRVFEWAFLDGAVSRDEYDELVGSAGLASVSDLHTLASMAALKLLDVTRWARERRPDLYDQYLHRCRSGLAALLAGVC